MRKFFLLPLALGACASVSDVPPSATPELVMRGIASTAESTEVRIAFSPDGNRRLWGRIAKDNPKGWQIVESVRQGSGWSTPVELSFNSDANDFDPFFAPNGRSLLFFSNRPGGRGGDDLWVAPFDPATGRYGAAVNLGASVNTPANEWAPTLSPDGRTLLFSSNGHGGSGGQDLFVSVRGADGSWGAPRNLGTGINSAADDFDATFFGNDVLVYTSGNAEDGPIALYRARRSGITWVGRERLPAPFNCSPTFNLGPAWNPREPRLLYYSAGCPEIGAGRADIFVAPLPR